MFLDNCKKCVLIPNLTVISDESQAAFPSPTQPSCRSHDKFRLLAPCSAGITQSQYADRPATQQALHYGKPGPSANIITSRPLDQSILKPPAALSETLNYIQILHRSSEMYGSCQ